MADSIIYRDVLEILGKIVPSPTTLWSISDAVWQTLCADKDRHGERAPFSYRSAMLDVLRYASNMSVSTDSENGAEVMPSIDVEDLLENTDLSHAHEFLRRVRNTVWNRRAFRSRTSPAGEDASKSMVGLVPRGARTGDVLCILYGCSVPIALRKSQSSASDDTWVLIGDAYVNGAMYGEEVKHKLLSGSIENSEREVRIK